MNKILAKYVGPKPSETDCVAGTGLTWQPGEVLEVPEKAWAIMARHPDVWACAGVIEMAEVSAQPLAADVAISVTDADGVTVELVKTDDGWTLPDGTVFANAAAADAGDDDIDEIPALRQQIRDAGGTYDGRWKEARLRKALAELTGG